MKFCFVRDMAGAVASLLEIQSARMAPDLIAFANSGLKAISALPRSVSSVGFIAD